MEFPEGRGGLSWELILENPEGGRGHMKNPFRGGVWIFSGTTQLSWRLFFGTAKRLTTVGGR